LDARIAVRAYLRNSKTKPETAAEIFFQSISQFSDPDVNDRKIWKWVIQNVKPNTVTTVLQKAHDHRSESLSESQGTVLVLRVPAPHICVHHSS
jgi:tRNA A37 threonylcarbamoyladenosine synthetase subunit TsaC/SUA5/YrdC